MKKSAVFLLVLLIASTGSAAIRDRLQPIFTGSSGIEVDSFIVATHDKYIATIVRDVSNAFDDDLTITLKDMINSYDKNDLAIVEKRIFDKNSKRVSLVERRLTLKSDLYLTLGSEPLNKSDLKEVEPGSVEELIWNGVAGPDGWGTKILTDYPKPVQLSENKWPREADRYIPVVLDKEGGLFIDRESIEIAPDGCTATAVQAFSGDGELQTGGIIMQFTFQPYEDAIYAITVSDYSFSKKAVRQTRYTVFGPNDKIIYSVKMADPIWEDVDMNPMSMPALGLLSQNLPENLYSVLSADVKEFTKFAIEKYEEVKKMFPPETEEEEEQK